MSDKLWGGRFSTPASKLAEEFGASIDFDKTLMSHDIAGSIAHATMLGATGIIAAQESAALVDGLRSVEAKLTRGEYAYRIEDEDIHMNIERFLHAEIGPLAGKLHTARSRNDQVALDLHLYLREHVLHIIGDLIALQSRLEALATKHFGVVMPGYTHLQRAQPILLSHHLAAYAWMFGRDIERLQDGYRRINLSPLGAGALAGTTFPIDRGAVAKQLHFPALYPNSMDAVSDRDFAVEFLSASALIMVHLSRLSEELIIWSSREFGFIEIDDAFATGSSIMPQKKNPDMAELIRGKSGRVFGSLVGLLTVLKGLPLTYNKDLQEDKEGIFDTVETLEKALPIMSAMIETMQVHTEVIEQAVREDFSNATDLADYLAKRGMPFREAHEVVGRIVGECVRSKRYLLDLSLEEMQKHSSLIGADIFSVLDPKTVVAQRKSIGGTGNDAVADQLAHLRARIGEAQRWLSGEQEKIAERTVR